MNLDKPTDNTIHLEKYELEICMLAPAVELEGEDHPLLIAQPRPVPPGPGGTAPRAEKRKRKSQFTEQQKKMRRVLSNRRSAKTGRDTRRQLLTELSSKAAMFSAQNKCLAKANSELCAQVEEIKHQLQLVLDSNRRRAMQQQQHQHGGFEPQRSAEVLCCGADGMMQEHTPVGLHAEVFDLADNAIVSKHRKMGKGEPASDSGSLLSFNHQHQPSAVAFVGAN